ncbi:DUF72 domain-containing protein [Methylocella sp.]|uniref:DUF72 domain-containing protein n=1 Tax=Methylocella sp. TaxID=1978226 RepID=UPI00378326A0
MKGNVRIAVAGWSVPKDCASRFPAAGSHLGRYAQVMRAVEINSSFYRAHRRRTYERWAAAAPPDFSFAVKIPREISHRRRLVDAREPLLRFLDETAGLGEKRGPLLLQLPPSLPFRDAQAAAFFETARALYDGDMVCEPRHPSWFAPLVEATLQTFRVARVGADPPPAPGADDPAGWRGLVYLRLHGSPKTYYSAYGEERLRALAVVLTRAAAVPTWCVFDNTAEGEAIRDALRLASLLGEAP